MFLYRIEQKWRSSGKVKKVQVFWVKAPNARAASKYLPSNCSSQEIERFGACDWAREGIVFDSSKGILKEAKL